jgi:hypothetical protein
MYCQTCGSALTHQTKYCNRCGTQLMPAAEKSVEKTPEEKRLDEYLEGLFWISVFGLAIIIGGSVLLKKVQFSNLILIGYMILSTSVFLVNFGIALWGALSLMRSTKDGKLTIQPGRADADTRELGPPKGEPVRLTGASVTEHTTRSFEPIPARDVLPQSRKDAKEEV